MNCPVCCAVAAFQQWRARRQQARAAMKTQDQAEKPRPGELQQRSAPVDGWLAVERLLEAQREESYRQGWRPLDSANDFNAPERWFSRRRPWWMK